MAFKNVTMIAGGMAAATAASKLMWEDESITSPRSASFIAATGAALAASKMTKRPDVVLISAVTASIFAYGALNTEPTVTTTVVHYQPKMLCNSPRAKRQW